MTEAEYLRSRLADMIADASDGEVAAELALAGNHSLNALDLDLGADLSSFDNIDAIANQVATALAAR